MANFTKFFGKKFYYRSLLNSLKLTVCVTICSLLIGVPLAYIMSFFKIRGKGVIEILIIISMMSPNFIGAYSWILLLGRSGVITKFLSNTFGIQMPAIYGFGGMLLVLSVSYTHLWCLPPPRRRCINFCLKNGPIHHNRQLWIGTNNRRFTGCPPK